VLDHAFRNAFAPLITLIGLQLPALFSGALVLEVVFGWPGVGRLAYSSALGYDFPLVLGTTTFVAIMVILGNLFADVLYAVADPRIRNT
jgi:peptide/nickel transport system permease protein